MALSPFIPMFDFVLAAYQEGVSVKGRGVSAHAIAVVFGVIFRYTRMSKSDPRCAVGAKRLAMRAHLDETTTRRCIQALNNDGWISTTQRPGKTPTYRMTEKSNAALGQRSARASSKQVVYDE